MQGIDFIFQEEDFQQTLSRLASKHNTPIEDVQKDAKEYITELYSEHDPYADSAMFELIKFTLSRGYDKTIDIDPDELKALGKLMRRNSVAFVMTHKTYIDMWVLALVLARHGLPIPYIFAGINLSFFGVGKLGRKAGVIFIRRSFKDNEIYKASLRHFLAHLVKQREHFMWAIEGTRSRTGKLVWPKMGILKYIAEGEKQSKDEVKYVPVSVVYDLIQDVQEMTMEGRGKQKNSENLMWMMNYIKDMGKNYGRISVRIGEPIEREEEHFAEIPNDFQAPTEKYTLPKLAFELVHRINQITPVTTASLICTTLLSKFSLTKNLIEYNVLSLMNIVERHKADTLVDRGVPISQSVQYALNLLKQANLIQQIGEGAKAKYAIVPEKYLISTYYSNMCVHHLYHRAFIELAILKAAKFKPSEREDVFWKEIMNLRDLFKFEFFYSNKPNFSDEIEYDFGLMDEDWRAKLNHKNKEKLLDILRDQPILISQVVLHTYIEAYTVVALALQNMDKNEEYNENRLLHECMFLGEEMHWQGKIHRIESISKPFVINGLRFAQNRNLIPKGKNRKKKELEVLFDELTVLADYIKELQDYVLRTSTNEAKVIPLEKNVVPGSKIESLTTGITDSEEGPHIGAFFDLDRTLIKGFSASKFLKTRILSGKMKNREIVAQFGGALVYAVGDKNFASLAAIGAKGVKGIKEDVFKQVGEEVYYKYLAKAIYPESRALVAAHLAKGHTVAIISAATPYQVTPVASDLGIEHVMCTKMEVVNGKFTGNIVEPACWGEGKAHASQVLSDTLNLDLSKSYFYTDSAEDMPLLDMVGNPVAINPDKELSAKAYVNDWPVYRFDGVDRNTVTNYLRTALTMASLFPAAAKGFLTGTRGRSWDQGRNSMMASFGDLAARLAGINLAVKGEEKIWASRPCVFILNHQSNADMIIASKLLRKDTVGIGKKEIQKMPVLGQILTASKGMIFIDRTNKEKAIEAMKPAVDALKSGTSVVIFPEGTRSYDYSLGQFKKGAFHLAMQAKVPIVPIVIENAHDVMPRGRNIIKPATICITVLDPVPTKTWKKADLAKHIKKIRDQYLEVMGQKDVKELSAGKTKGLKKKA
jgi:putative phosphoserine phosphatase/1-acylglycerol-3-phosphate O-acyltransferase